MKTDLSLLPNQAKFQASKIKLKEKIDIFNWSFSFFWVALVLIIFIIWILFTARLYVVDKDYQKNDNLYQSMAQDLLINRQIKVEAKLVGQILAKRFEYGKSLKDISNLFSSSFVDLEDSKLGDVKQFILKGSATGKEGINEVEKKVDSINSGVIPDFESAKLTVLSEQNNVWQFGMEVNVK